MPNRLMKALRGRPAKTTEARGTISGFVPGVSPTWGQPYPEQVAGDASGLISRQRMREIVLRTPTTAASVNAILDFAAGVKIDLRNIDASKPVPPEQYQTVKRTMRTPNPTQSRRQLLLSLMRDIVTFGYGAIELVRTNKAGHPVDMWVMDAARLRIDFDEHGLIKGYDMLNARGMPVRKQVKPNGPGTNDLYGFPQGNRMGANSEPADAKGQHGWEPNEVILFSLNPVSESVYPNSRIVQLFSSAVLEDLMIAFIADRFTDSNIPFGVFDLGDVTETELQLAIDNWNMQGKSGNRILMTGSKGSGSKWIPFGYHLKDLEATALLSEVRMKIMGILGVTMQELGESQDVNKSNGYNLSFTFKKRAIEPLLDEITETLTRCLLWDALGYTEIEFYYEEIDSRDDFLMSQIDSNYMKLGIIKPNEIRNRKGSPNLPGGDDALVFTGSSWIPLDMLRKMAEQLVIAEQTGSASSITGPEGADMARIKPGGSQQGGGGAGGTLSGTGRSSSNGHNRGASSSMARQLTGQKAISKGRPPDLFDAGLEWPEDRES